MFDVKTPNGTTGLHFLVSTGVEKPDPELRKLIRSHVMQGKNKGKTLPSRKKKPKVVQDRIVSPPSSLSAETSTSPPDLPYWASVPAKFGSSVSTFQFPDAVEPSTVEVVLNLSSISKQILFPLEPCIFFDRRAENWVAPLLIDAAYLHTMIFTSQYYFDSILSKTIVPTSQRSFPHYLKTLSILRERMAGTDVQAKLSLMTLAAVMGLAGFAHITGDVKAARNHMEGILKIVELRGGVSTFEENAKLLVEIFRTDLGIALHNGTPTTFFNSSLPPYPDLTPLLCLLPHQPQPPPSFLTHLPTSISTTLIPLITHLQTFTKLVNHAHHTTQKLTTELYLSTMSSTLYRLLSLIYPRSSVDETLRLGLLAFATGIFLQWRGLGVPYLWLRSALRGCIEGKGLEGLEGEVRVWLLMVGAVSVLEGVDEVWLIPLLGDSIGECGIEEWGTMQQVLEGFMWIGLVHDKPGRAVFESAMRWKAKA